MLQVSISVLNSADNRQMWTPAWYRASTDSQTGVVLTAPLVAGNRDLVFPTSLPFVNECQF